MSAYSPSLRCLSFVHTFEIVEFKAFRGFSRLSRGQIQGYFSDQEHENCRATAPKKNHNNNIRVFKTRFVALHMNVNKMQVAATMKKIKK